LISTRPLSMTFSNENYTTSISSFITTYNMITTPSYAELRRRTLTCQWRSLNQEARWYVIFLVTLLVHNSWVQMLLFGTFSNRNNIRSLRVLALYIILVTLSVMLCTSITVCLDCLPRDSIYPRRVQCNTRLTLPRWTEETLVSRYSLSCLLFYPIFMIQQTDEPQIGCVSKGNT
jgi:hypothetical protein